MKLVYINPDCFADVDLNLLKYLAREFEVAWYPVYYTDRRIYVSPEEKLVPAENRTGLPGVLPVLLFRGSRLDSGLKEDRLYGSPGFHFTPGSFTAIPYCLWCNREPGEMTVWLKALLRPDDTVGAE